MCSTLVVGPSIHHASSSSPSTTVLHCSFTAPQSNQHPGPPVVALDLDLVFGAFGGHHKTAPSPPRPPPLLQGVSGFLAHTPLPTPLGVNFSASFPRLNLPRYNPSRNHPHLAGSKTMRVSPVEPRSTCTIRCALNQSPPAVAAHVSNRH